MTEWIGLVGAFSALAGTAMGGLITYLVARQQHRHERESEKHRRLVESFEATHELLSDVASITSVMGAAVVGAIANEEPIPESAIEGEKVPIERLRMLVDFYAPSLRSEVLAISEQINVVGMAVTETLTKENRDEAWKAETTALAVAASSEILKQVRSAQAKLAEIVRPIVS